MGFSLYFQSAREKGSKMEISMDKQTFPWGNLELLEQFHVIKEVFKAKYSLNSIWIQEGMISANPSLIPKLSKTFPTFYEKASADVWSQTGQFQGELQILLCLGLQCCGLIPDLTPNPGFHSLWILHTLASIEI